MVDDPRDRVAYRIAIGLLGLAVVAALFAIGWVSAEHWCVRNIPNQLWFIGAGFGGVFVGALIPFPLPSAHSSSSEKTTFARAVLRMIALAFALGAFAVAAARAEWLQWSVLAVTAAAVLVGLLIPSPSGRDR